MTLRTLKPTLASPALGPAHLSVYLPWGVEVLLVAGPRTASGENEGLQEGGQDKHGVGNAGQDWL